MGAVLDSNTGAQLKYRDLVKKQTCTNNGPNPWGTSSDVWRKASVRSKEQIQFFIPKS